MSIGSTDDYGDLVKRMGMVAHQVLDQPGKNRLEELLPFLFMLFGLIALSEFIFTVLFTLPNNNIHESLSLNRNSDSGVTNNLALVCRNERLSAKFLSTI